MGYNLETEMYEGYIYKIVNDVNDKIYIGQTTTTIQARWHGHTSAAINDKRNKSVLYKAMCKYGRDKFHIIELRQVECKTKEELIGKLNALEQSYIKEYKCTINDEPGGYNTEYGGNNKQVNGRHVCKYDLNLNFIEDYCSIEEAGRRNGVDGCTIWSVCHHDYYTAGGYVWAFYGEPPVMPPTKEESAQKRIETFHKNYKPVKKEKKIKPFISHALPKEVKELNRKQRLGDDGRRIFQYNAFGEVIHIYNSFTDAIDHIPIKSQELRLNLSGKNLQYNNTILRYEEDPFDKFPQSKKLHPIDLYDLQGNYINRFATLKEVEDLIGGDSSEITKAIKRGGSYMGFLFADYGKPLQRKLNRMHKTYLMLDCNMNIIKEFESRKAVANFLNKGDCYKSLDKAIKTKQIYENYYWQIKEEFPINSN